MPCESTGDTDGAAGLKINYEKCLTVEEIDRERGRGCERGREREREGERESERESERERDREKESAGKRP